MECSLLRPGPTLGILGLGHGLCLSSGVRRWFFCGFLLNVLETEGSHAAL